MSLVSVSRWEPGKHPRRHDAARFGVRGNTASSKGGLRGGAWRRSWQPVAQTEDRDLATATMPNAARTPLLCDSCCFPPASPAFVSGAGKQKTAPKDHFKHLIPTALSFDLGPFSGSN
jgi:hypothetical protein